ncbi:MAG: UbiD family decarboxylase [Thermodesulfobacteriota bacterium]
MPKEKNLRTFMEQLEAAGLLARVKQEVDPRYELAGVMFKSVLAKGPALLFTNVKGKGIALVANLCASRQRMARALDTTPDRAGEVYLERLKRYLPPERSSSGSCQQVVEAEVDLDSLPIITAHEYDAGPYISCGVVVARHPDSGLANLSLHRIFPLSKDKAAIFINPASDLAQYYRSAGNSPLAIAVVLGLHPAFLMAGAAKFPLGVDEYDVAGSFLGQPTRLVKCQTSDIEVPVDAEIVLEGEIAQGERVPEGPFGEYPGTYGAGNLTPKDAPVIHFKCFTHREQPIYQAIICGPTLGHESTYLNCVSREGGLYTATKAVCPAVKAVCIHPCRYVAAIQLGGGYHPGDVGLILAAAFSTNDFVKYVVVVNEDVDIADPADLFWAMSTRVDPGRDFHIFPQMREDALDPSTNRVCDKVGIDASVPLDVDARGFTRTRIPNLDKINLAKYLEAFL